MNQKNDKTINIIGGGKPIIAIIGTVHGDEVIGKKIIDQLKTLKIKKGTLITIIGNDKALKRKKRFIDQDLNRSFPGKKNGNHEEKLAYNIKKIISKVDFLIDIHSTTTDVKSLAIITKFNKSILKLINYLNPKRVALMKNSFSKPSLTYYCKAGISLEYGKDKSKLVYKNSLNDILLILKKLEMIDVNLKKKKNKTDFYKISGSVKKNSGFILNKDISNFNRIREGDIIATKGKKKIKAKKDFYPILFGDKAYKDIFGFSAKKVDKF